MTKQSLTDITLKKDSSVKFSLRGLWALILAIVIGSFAVSGYMWRVDQRITDLSIRANQQHEQVMLKLVEMDVRQQMFVLKKELVNVLVYVSKERDLRLSPTNTLVRDEIVFRQALSEFLK